MNARYTMLDSMGVYQHHDGVTGTSKQIVADDYSERLFESMEASNAVFAHYIADYTERYGGVKSESWSMCTVRNSTYHDCPVADGTDEFVITTYNPAAVESGLQSFKVPPASSYQVEQFDFRSQDWLSVASTLLCYDKFVNDADHSVITDCNLYLNLTARAHHLTYLKLKAVNNDRKVSS